MFAKSLSCANYYISSNKNGICTTYSQEICPTTAVGSAIGLTLSSPNHYYYTTAYCPHWTLRMIEETVIILTTRPGRHSFLQNKILTILYQNRPMSPLRSSLLVHHQNCALYMLNNTAYLTLFLVLESVSLTAYSSQIHNKYISG